MKRVFKLLQNNTLIFGQTHQLTSCWTDEYKAFSIFRMWKMGSQKARLKKQNPVLLNVAIKIFVHSFVTQTFTRYINDLLFHFLFLNITNSIIDFISFTRQYPWRNSKTNGRRISNILIRCKQSVQTYRLLFRTSLCIATIMVCVILRQVGWLAH
jgi:hypothetical protein